MKVSDFDPLGQAGKQLKKGMSAYQGTNAPSDVIKNQEVLKGREEGIQSINAFGFGTTALPMGVVDFSDTKNLIDEYRSMAITEATVDYAIDDIVNETVSVDEEEDPITLDLTACEGMSPNIQNNVRAAWDIIARLLDLNDNVYERFRSWYTDGRAAYHLVFDNDSDNAKRSIKKIEILDPRFVKKVHLNTIDAKTRVTGGITQVSDTKPVYVYNPSEAENNSSYSAMYNFSSQAHASIEPANMVYFHSGIVSPCGTRILGHLEKARKPLNNLKMVKDSMIIYRLTNSTEKRVFYIDCGDMGKTAAEEHVKKLMNRYRNRLSYDPQTGKVKGSSNRMTMIEDFWIPRSSEGKGTQVETLPAGQNLGEMDDVLYCQKELYRSLNVPASRLEQEGGGLINNGQMAEINRDEWKFGKFISRLKRRFGSGLIEILHRQVIAQKIMKEEEWKLYEPNIKLVFAADSYVREQRENEDLNQKLAAVQMADPFVGKYFSLDYVKKKILRFSEEEQKEQDAQIEKEKKAGAYDPPAGEEPGGFPQ